MGRQAVAIREPVQPAATESPAEALDPESAQSSVWTWMPVHVSLLLGLSSTLGIEHLPHVVRAPLRAHSFPGRCRMSTIVKVTLSPVVALGLGSFSCTQRSP